MIALIPARAGSARLPGKHLRLLGGLPLIDYTLAAARGSAWFERIEVWSDDQAVLAYAADRGIAAHWRPPVSADQPDIDWVREALVSPRADTFAILRATSPFRTAATIRRAGAQFTSMGSCGDSLRAVEPVTQTPYKMWTWEGPGQPIQPLLAGTNPAGVPWHSCPTQTCPQVWAQNACLEMGWTANVEVHGTIHGRKVAPFFTEGYEGVDLNTEADWAYAEWLLATGRVTGSSLNEWVPIGMEKDGRIVLASTLPE
mgnify:CR=1 FL=1